MAGTGRDEVPVDDCWSCDSAPERRRDSKWLNDSLIVCAASGVPEVEVAVRCATSLASVDSFKNDVLPSYNPLAPLGLIS